MENAWLINEPKRKGVKRKMAKKRKRVRRNDPDPARKKRRRYRRNDPDPDPARRRRRRRYRRNDPDPARRRRRRYRRNEPDPAMTDILWAAGGYVGTKFVGNMVTPAIGITSPIARMAVKGGIAYIGGNFLISRFAGRRAGEMFMVGGLVEVIGDAVKTWLAPSIPALAAYQEPLEVSDVGAYPELEAYPESIEEVSDVGEEVAYE